MKDRIVQQPGRVKIVPANGSEEQIVFIERADTVIQEGTPLNKANLLDDTTAQALDLAPDADTGYPTPNDAFFEIASKLNCQNLSREEHYRRDSVLYKNIYNGDSGIISGLATTADGTTTLKVQAGDILLPNGRVIALDKECFINTAAFKGRDFLQIIVYAGTEGSLEFSYIGQSNVPAVYSSLNECELCTVELDSSGYAVRVVRTLKILPSVAARLPFVIKNIKLTADMFISDTTYSTYPYKAIIPIEVISKNHFCEVILPLEIADSGNFSSCCESIAGGIVLYAKSVPTYDFTIPLIKAEVII